MVCLCRISWIFFFEKKKILPDISSVGKKAQQNTSEVRNVIERLFFCRMVQLQGQGSRLFKFCQAKAFLKVYIFVEFILKPNEIFFCTGALQIFGLVVILMGLRAILIVGPLIHLRVSIRIFSFFDKQ